MYWSCLCLNKYWREVFHTLSLVLNIKLEPNLLNTVFGIMEGEKKLPTARKHTLSFASLLARPAILFRWKDTFPPTHAQWLEDIMSCLKLEKIRYSLQQSNNKLQRVWGSFLKAVQTLWRFDPWMQVNYAAHFLLTASASSWCNSDLMLWLVLWQWQRRDWFVHYLIVVLFLFFSFLLHSCTLCTLMYAVIDIPMLIPYLCNDHSALHFCYMEKTSIKKYLELKKALIDWMGKHPWLSSKPARVLKPVRNHRGILMAYTTYVAICQKAIFHLGVYSFCGVQSNACFTQNATELNHIAVGSSD